MVRLRSATEQDAQSIRRLIHQVGINPLALDWRRFTLAVDEQDRMIGCGQIKPHAGGLRELASIAVEPAYRSQGIARRIIEQLLSATPPPVYLTCRQSLTSFYEKFGFHALQAHQMPSYYRRLWTLVHWMKRLNPRLEGMQVMVKP